MHLIERNEVLDLNFNPVRWLNVVRSSSILFNENGRPFLHESRAIFRNKGGFISREAIRRAGLSLDPIRFNPGEFWLSSISQRSILCGLEESGEVNDWLSELFQEGCSLKELRTDSPSELRLLCLIEWAKVRDNTADSAREAGAHIVVSSSAFVNEPSSGVIQIDRMRFVLGDAVHTEQGPTSFFRYLVPEKQKGMIERK